MTASRNKSDYEKVVEAHYRIEDLEEYLRIAQDEVLELLQKGTFTPLEKVKLLALAKQKENRILLNLRGEMRS